MQINGMLLLDKPTGMSSNYALQKAKRIFEANKAGHTGSLDPLATGVLPLCFGETTKIASYFLNGDKEYQVSISLGTSTDTGDSEGKIIDQQPVGISQGKLDQVLPQFRGSYPQVPPMFSALKQNGQPLYKLARQGIEVERKARDVTVYRLTLDRWDNQTLDLTVSCSKGFYIRTLATEIGAALGCGGHVIRLRRTGLGQFTLENTVTLEELEAFSTAREREALLVPSDQALIHFPQITIPENLAVYLTQGRAVRPPEVQGLPENELIRMYSQSGGFLGLGILSEDRKIVPKRMFVSQ